MDAFVATAKKNNILMVDDQVDNLLALGSILSPNNDVRMARSGEQALELAAAEPPDLILLDIVMPGMDGFEVLSRLKAEDATKNIPVIFITGQRTDDAEEKGIALGAADYIRKPFRAGIVRARVDMQLRLKAASDILTDKAERLAHQVARRAKEVQEGRGAAIMTMVSLAEERDNETGAHMLRTQHYVRALAEALKGNPRFASYLTDSAIDILFKSAPLHDIGKVGIPDSILLKPSRLTEQERAVMRQHPGIGYKAIVNAEKKLGCSLDFLACAKQLIYSHHEMWDGRGYPEGLSGEDIPIPARLMALADVYDALISHRVYKEALPSDEACKIIATGAGRHFDPDVVRAFEAKEREFQDIARRFKD
ncbi:MAG: two-component system response regulator [Acidobacteriota bacterium]|jgi:putative two-component system response regulator|nr:two-component system response regulator [Acidobacteriota bacterium]